MKTTAVASLIFIALITLGFAGKPHKGGGRRPPPRQQQMSAASTEPQLPSALLLQFTAAHLDHILAPLDQQVALPRTELSQLRAGLASDSAKAPAPDKAQYQTAIAVCDALSQAMDEREKAVSNAQAASNAVVSQDVHDVRESLPRHGRGSGKAAHAGLHQQQNENKQAQNDAAQKSAFLSSVHTKQWADRTPILRQRVQQLSSQQLQAERSATQAKASATPTAAPQ